MAAEAASADFGRARVRVIGSVGRRGSAVCRERGFVAKTQRPWSYTRPRNDLIVSVIMNAPIVSVPPIASPDLPATLAPPAPALPKQDQSLGDERQSADARPRFRGAPPCGMVTGAHRAARVPQPFRSDGKATNSSSLAANLDGLGLRRMTTPDDVKLHHTSQGGV